MHSIIHYTDLFTLSIERYTHSFLHTSITISLGRGFQPGNLNICPKVSGNALKCDNRHGPGSQCIQE